MKFREMLKEIMEPSQFYKNEPAQKIDQTIKNHLKGDVVGTEPDAKKPVKKRKPFGKWLRSVDGDEKTTDG